MTQQKPETQPEAAEETLDESEVHTSRIETTPEEMEAFYLVKSLLVGTVEPERIAIRDGVNFCNILLDDKITKPLFRLHFNRRPWRVGLFDGDNKDDRLEIGKLDDILPLANRIRATARKYDMAKKGKEDG